MKKIIIYLFLLCPVFASAQINYQSTGNSIKLLPGSVIKPITTITPYGINSTAVQDAIFGSLDQSQINTGILTDYGLDLADQTLYNGTIGATNQMTIGAWRGLYASLLTSVINPASNMISLKTINQQLETYWSSYNLNEPKVNIATLFVAYQSLRSDAVSQNLISIRRGFYGYVYTPYPSKWGIYLLSICNKWVIV